MNTFNPDALKTQLETLQNRVTTRQQALNTYLKNPSQTALPANVFDPDAQRAWDAVGGMQAYKEVLDQLAAVLGVLNDRAQYAGEALSLLYEDVRLMGHLRNVLTLADLSKNTLQPGDRAELIESLHILQQKLLPQGLDQVAQARTALQGALSSYMNSNGDLNTVEARVAAFREAVNDARRMGVSQNRLAMFDLEVAAFERTLQQHQALHYVTRAQPPTVGAQDPAQLLARLDELWSVLQNSPREIFARYAEFWLNAFNAAMRAYVRLNGAAAAPLAKYVTAAQRFPQQGPQGGAAALPLPGVAFGGVVSSGNGGGRLPLLIGVGVLALIGLLFGIAALLTATGINGQLVALRLTFESPTMLPITTAPTAAVSLATLSSTVEPTSGNPATVDVPPGTPLVVAPLNAVTTQAATTISTTAATESVPQVPTEAATTAPATFTDTPITSTLTTAPPTLTDTPTASITPTLPPTQAATATLAATVPATLIPTQSVATALSGVSFQPDPKSATSWVMQKSTGIATSPATPSDSMPTFWLCRVDNPKKSVFNTSELCQLTFTGTLPTASKAALQGNASVPLQLKGTQNPLIDTGNLTLNSDSLSFTINLLDPAIKTDTYSVVLKAGGDQPLFRFVAASLPSAPLIATVSGSKSLTASSVSTVPRVEHIVLNAQMSKLDIQLTYAAPLPIQISVSNHGGPQLTNPGNASDNSITLPGTGGSTMSLTWNAIAKEKLPDNTGVKLVIIETPTERQWFLVSFSFGTGSGISPVAPSGALQSSVDNKIRLVTFQNPSQEATLYRSGRARWFYMWVPQAEIVNGVWKVPTTTGVPLNFAELTNPNTLKPATLAVAGTSTANMISANAATSITPDILGTITTDSGDVYDLIKISGVNG